MMNKSLIKNDRIISMDQNLGDFENADILIHHDKIVELSNNINTDDALLIDASDYLIVPGFVNTHVHTWHTGLRSLEAAWTLSDSLDSLHEGLAAFYKPDGLYIANYIGDLYQINT